MILKFKFVYFILKLILSNKVKTVQLGWRLSILRLYIKLF
jgi:hypothetical protein